MPGGPILMGAPPVVNLSPNGGDMGELNIV
jgi:hypothetical protein